LNKQNKNVCRASVLRIMDDILPESDPNYFQLPRDYSGSIRGFHYKNHINAKKVRKSTKTKKR
jgi:hypothetical protein